MSSSISTRSAVTIAAVTVVGGLIAYAAYFDYKRRNDAQFRKKLRKEKKRVERTRPDVLTPGGGSRSTEEIKEALQMIRNEQLPAGAEEKEQYFMENVQIGEQLCTQGPAFEIPAALAFYRALRVYPSPVELIMIYQKTVPESVFKIVMEMTSLDVSSPDPEPQEAKKESAPSSPSPSSQRGRGSGSDDEQEREKSVPPSETSSQGDWDKLTDPTSASTTIPPPGTEESDFPPLSS
ncbi:hypothetical protein FRB94_000152 [Tulasnella sp. JGI-2019a]|nr:hypothetical protein FRB94_000152 [Tulasnella sp. JGI-2019a]